jgi:hypothetical protein
MQHGLYQHGSGHLFMFRGRKANLIKIVYWPLHQAGRTGRVPVAAGRRSG